MGLSGAERQRRWRERQRRGVQVVAVEIDQETVERLLARRLIRVEELGNPKRISAALARMAREDGDRTA